MTTVKFARSCRYLALLLPWVVVGCASTPSGSALRVKIAEPHEVAKCKFVTNVKGSSILGNLAGSRGIENSKTEALEKAAGAGATHVVWKDTSWFMGSSASGEAYRCD